MATEGPRSSTSSADSYIGSLISLTSKSEIRYEGILYNINTEESSIGLTNVRSFGTEGRKKDGPQLPPSDKVYEYILFRGSDIKDLQVKSSQPVQPTQPINSDPAIIQSHYPPPATASSNLPAAANNSSSGPSPNMGHPGSTFQGGLPLYQPGGNLGSWAPSPPPPNTNAMPPMYWPGYYPNTLTQLHQQPLPPPPQGLGGMPPPLQPPPMQYPSFNASGASNTLENSSSLLPTSSSFPPMLATGSLPNLMQNKPPNSVVSTATPTPPIGSLQSQSSLTTTTNDVPNVLSGGSKFHYQGTSQAPESFTPPLITPGQLLQSVPASVVSTQSPPAAIVNNDVEVVPASSSPPSVPISVSTEAQPPILPLPPQAQIAPKPNGGATYHNRSSYNYRGRERGRGSGASQPKMNFTEEFDFSAMNEKFNKDEVWGTLGKSNKSGSKEKDEYGSDEDDPEEENDPNLPKVDAKPVYSKDDFFDSLSCNSLDRQSNNGRSRFSEQRKLDTETFGEFSNRYRGGGRGGRGPNRGGRYRGGGGYYGRGGYGYGGRGRGGGRIPNQSNEY